MSGATSDARGGGEDDRPNPSSCHEPHQVRLLIFDIRYIFEPHQERFFNI